MDFNGSICVSDIPKQYLRRGKNGKFYLSITINERRTPSQYGDTHYIKVRVPREEASAERKPIYIGDLKPFNYEPKPDDNEPKPDISQPDIPQPDFDVTTDPDLPF